MAVRRGKRAEPRADKKLEIIKKTKKKVDNKVLIVAQEIKFAKILAGNDHAAREKEKLCESISKLHDCFGQDKIETSVLFYKCFLSTMATDWFGIDQHRLDKFLMLVRRMTRGILKCLKDVQWSTKSLSSLNDCLTGDGGVFSVDHPKLCLGLQMHLVDCWMEEVSKISDGDISAKQVVSLTKPFAQFLSYGEDTRLSTSITRNIFIHLVRQTDTGIEYNEKLFAWRSAGYPGGSVDAMQRVEIENDDDETYNNNDGDDMIESTRSVEFDPRAGNVDTELPQLPVDGNLFIAMFKKLATDSKTTKWNRDKLRKLAKNFETLASGDYPFKFKDVDAENDTKFKLPKTQKTALELLEFEDKLMIDKEDEEMKGMSKRQKRKHLMKQRKLLEAGLLSDDDLDCDAASNETNLENPPPAKKAKKKSPEKADASVWMVEALDESSNVSRPGLSPHQSTEKQCATSTEIERKKSKKDRKSILQQSISLTNSTPFQSKKKTIEKKDTLQSKVSIGNADVDSSPSLLVKEKRTPSVKKMTPGKKVLKENQSVNSLTPIKSKTRNQKNLNVSLDAVSSKSQLKSPSVTKTESVPVTPQKETIVNISTPKRQKSITQSKKNDISSKNSQLSTASNKREKKLRKNNLITNPSLNRTAPVQSNNKALQKVKSQANLSFSCSTPTQKKVMIALKKNTSQGVMDYFKSVKQSPEIPFDGDKKPTKTSLKPNAMPSPINPFYKKKLKLNF